MVNLLWKSAADGAQYPMGVHAAQVTDALPCHDSFTRVSLTALLALDEGATRATQSVSNCRGISRAGDNFESFGNSFKSRKLVSARSNDDETAARPHEIQGTVRTMAATGNHGGGRRSKGDRKFIGFRLETGRAEKLSRIAHEDGMPVSDVVAAIIERELEIMEKNREEMQEELPIGRIAS